MARNRMIKPEFWADDKIGRLSAYSRLLFIAIWNFSDDYGVYSAKPRRILGECFENDESVTEAKLKNLLKELEDSCLIKIFFAQNREWIHVVNWEKHQKIDRRSSRKYPSPEEASADTRRTLEEASASKEKEKEKEKEKDIICRTKPDVVDLKKFNSQEAIKFLNEVCGSHYVPEAETNWRMVYRLFDEKMPDGRKVSLDAVKAVISRQAELWMGDPKMSEYLRPKTLFAKSNFNDYLTKAYSEYKNKEMKHARSN